MSKAGDIYLKSVRVFVEDPIVYEEDTRTLPKAFGRFPKANEGSRANGCNCGCE